MHRISTTWIYDNRATKLGGGWTRRQLELIGVNWPPAKGWIDRIGNGSHLICDSDRQAFEQEGKYPTTTATDDGEVLSTPAAPLTMRQVLDTLQQATAAERQEFLDWDDRNTRPRPKNPADYYDLSQLSTE